MQQAAEISRHIHRLRPFRPTMARASRTAAWSEIPPRGRVAAAVEVAAVASFVASDLFIPTLLILALTVVSLAIRRQGISSLGLRSIADPGRMVRSVTVTIVLWTLAQIGLIMPVLNRMTGQTQDLGQFDQMQGDFGLLAGLLALTWTLAAFGEEIAYRGLTLTRAASVMGSGVVGAVVAAILFGFAHTEQGLVGVVVTTLDGLLFGWLRLRHETLWAAIFAHGLSNSIGLITFFFTGPIYGLW